MTKDELLKLTKEIYKNITPIKLEGNWKDGFALGIHTASSKPIKNNQDEIIKWETERPPLGEALYRLKYWKEKDHAIKISLIAAVFLNTKIKKKEWNIDKIIPVPPSDLTRDFQPVYLLANQIAKILKIDLDISSLKKIKSTSEVKSIDDSASRREILKDAFSINLNSINGKDVLIFDDIYRSGETLNAVCDVIMNKGKARGVYVLTITKTRSKR
jgi:predicted amidophosphoribosyltransferase